LDREVRSNTTGVTNALLAEEITRIGVDQARSRLYPVLGLSSSFGDQRSEFSAGELSGSGRTVNTAAGLSLNFNLFNGGTTRRAIQQAQIQVEMAALDVENQQQAASQVFRNAWDRYQTQAAVHGLNERALSNARQTLKMAEERLAYGTISSFEFRDVQINLLRSEAEVLRSLQAWLAAWTGVQRLRGALRTSLKEE
jgi:outer membrane protein TolC